MYFSNPFAILLLFLGKIVKSVLQKEQDYNEGNKIEGAFANLQIYDSRQFFLYPTKGK